MNRHFLFIWSYDPSNPSPAFAHPKLDRQSRSPPDSRPRDIVPQLLTKGELQLISLNVSTTERFAANLVVQYQNDNALRGLL